MSLLQKKNERGEKCSQNGNRCDVKTSGDERTRTRTHDRVPFNFGWLNGIDGKRHALARLVALSPSWSLESTTSGEVITFAVVGPPLTSTVGAQVKKPMGLAAAPS